MAKDNFEDSLKAVLVHEGGYVNNPLDPGGPTNMGITLATLQAYSGRPISAEDVKALSRAKAAEIYRAQYWNAVRGDQLPLGLDYVMFDYAVNSGASRAIKELQRIVGVTSDGQLGGITLAAIRELPVSALITGMGEARLAFLQRLSTFRTFGKGWTRRVREVTERGLRMAEKRDRPSEPRTETPVEGKPRSKDVSVPRSTEARGPIATTAGTAGTIIAEQAKQVEQLAPYSGWLTVIFVVLTLTGVGLTIWTLVKRQREGDLE